MRRKLMLSLLIFLFVVCCDGQNLSKTEYYEKGLTFLENGNPGDAILSFKRAVERDQNYFEARYQLARAYMFQNRFINAETELIKVTRLNPSFHEAHILLAQIYIRNGKPDEALEEISIYMQENKDDPEAYAIMGSAYFSKLDFGKAEKYLKKSLQLSPEKTTPKLTLASLYEKQGKYSEANILLEKILKSDTRNKEALYLLASLKQRAGHFDDSAEAYKRIIETNPEEVIARLKLGLTYIYKKEFEKADEVAEQIMKTFLKKPEGYYLKGLVYFHTGKIDEAVISLRKAVSEEAVPGAHYYLGLYYLIKGNLDQATDEFQRVTDLVPDVLNAHLLLSLTHLKNRRVEAAINEAQRAVYINDKNAFAHNILGSAYLFAGQDDLAIEEFDKSIKLNPGLINAHIQKGTYNLLSGDSEKGEHEFQTAVEISPDLLSTRIILSKYYIARKKYDDAIKTLDEGLRENPNDAVLYNIIGSAYLGKNDIEQAIIFFEKAKSFNETFFLPYFNLANLYIETGSRDKGIEEYKKIIYLDNSNNQALIKLALALEAAKRDEEALGYFKKAAEQKSSTGYLSLAGYYMRNKDNKKAFEVLNRALIHKPKDINALDLKGNIYESEKNYRAALSEYRKIRKLSYERGVNRIVRMYEGMGNYDSAIEELEQFVANTAKKPAVLGKLADLYIKKKDFKSAEKAAKTIISMKTNSDLGYTILAKTYISKQYFKGAINTLKRAIESNPHSIDSRMMLGSVYISNGDLKRSLKVFQEVEKKNPGYAPSYFFQGNIFELMGKNEAAVQKYKKALELAPNYVPALNNLSYLYAEGHGQIGEAVRMASLAKKIAPEEGSVTDTLGWVMFKNGNYDDALKYFIETTHYIPGNPKVRYHLGLAYLKNSMPDKAERQLKNAVRLGNYSTFPEMDEARKILNDLTKK